MATSLRPASAPISPRSARGTVALVGAGFDQITARIHEFHRAISDLPFNGLAPLPAVGEGAAAVRVLHDGITDSVYTAIRGVGAALFGAARVALRAAERVTPAAIPAPRPRAADAVSAVNGIVGDYMARTRNPLAVRLGFYRDGARLALSPAALRTALPDASPRLAVFVHGLCCNESVWRFYPEAGAPYGERLAGDLGYTPVYVRYNSGLHISQNGRSLARQLQRLVESWPVPVAEIVLIGHSMGGLVARSACHMGGKRDAAWTRLVTNVLCLGSPHLGAPLERAVHAGVAAMAGFALTRPLARTLNVRSLGIKDLRYGYVADEDWRGRDPDTQFDNFRTPIPRLPGARYHFIGTTLGQSATDPIGVALGDGLVLLPSATAHELADADTAVLFASHHLRLLNHPAIYAQIAARLSPPAALPAP